MNELRIHKYDMLKVEFTSTSETTAGYKTKAPIVIEGKA